MKRLFATLALILFVAGCHAQQPPSTFGIAYSATAPASCTASAPCQIEYSDAPQVAGQCPATLPAVSCTSALGQTNCTHSNVTAAVTYCALAQTVQNGATSVPTAVIQVVVPPLPAAPSGVTGATTPTTTAEVQHDTGVEYALNKDGSLRVTHVIWTAAPIHFASN